MKRCITGLLLFVGFHGFAQPGIKDSIYSQVIKEERRLQIQVPDDYKPGSGKKYPVLYLLDGEWNAELFQQMQAWAKQWGFTPPVIMVGVVNSYPNGQNMRGRDLTPTVGGGTAADAGGGPKLLSFLKDELIPYIDKTYPSNGSNILWGHSLGGMFVLYALFTEPKLFDSYIAADPSVWWDHGFLIHYARERMGAVASAGGIKSLFITGRTGGAYHEMGIDSLESVLEKIAPPTLEWKAVAYSDETHVSQQGKSAYDGLKYTLSPLLQDRVHIDPLGGMVVKGMPFTVSCYNLFSDKYMRYTTDGSAPTPASLKMGAENVITPEADVRLNIKTFIVHDSADKVLAANFKLGASLAAEKPKGAVKGAWSYTGYRSPEGGTVIKSGTTLDRFNPNQIDTSDFFCRIGGYLETEKKGYYVFEMAGEPGTKLFLGDRLLMEIAKGTDYNSFIVAMEKGLHAIRFEYSHHKGGPNFDFSYKRPGEPGDGPLLPEVMYYVK